MLKKELNLDAELKVGPSGSFIVEVDGRPVVKKESLAFPTEQQILEAVSKAVGGSSNPPGS
ncbi:Rdx family protein [Archangium violaceum]|uniref:Rdx family protein n=1 Tax=Archangium violaceum TaxID=83451 RepID=UPI001EF00CC6|nr:Rdx family protein [Archangium violaceum]